jgi:hypothetical protein
MYMYISFDFFIKYMVLQFELFIHFCQFGINQYFHIGQKFRLQMKDWEHATCDATLKYC